LTREQGIQQIKSQEINNSIAAHNKKKELLELKKITIDKQQAFRSRLFNLKSLVEQWIQQYIVVASETGKVLFIGFFQENQLLNLGQELFYIQPSQSKYYGQLRIGQAGLGKVETGQKVLIKVNSYPSNEYGYLTGKVNYISSIPVNSDSFLIRVELPDGLQTNYNKTIFFRNSLLAEASVITSNKRLIHNFIGKLHDMIKR
jgi:HlyD family secretion protein